MRPALALTLSGNIQLLSQMPPVLAMALCGDMRLLSQMLASCPNPNPPWVYGTVVLNMLPTLTITLFENMQLSSQMLPALTLTLCGNMQLWSQTLPVLTLTLCRYMQLLS